MISRKAVELPPKKRSNDASFSLRFRSGANNSIESHNPLANNIQTPLCGTEETKKTPIAMSLPNENESTKGPNKPPETSQIRRAINLALTRFPNMLGSSRNSVGKLAVASPKQRIDIEDQTNLTIASPSVREGTGNVPEIKDRALFKCINVSDSSLAVTKDSTSPLHDSSPSITQDSFVTYHGDPTRDHLSFSRASSAAFSSFASNPHSHAPSTNSSHANLLALTGSSHDIHRDLTTHPPRSHLSSTYSHRSNSLHRWNRAGPSTSASFHILRSTGQGTNPSSLLRHASDPYLLHGSLNSSSVQGNSNPNGAVQPTPFGYHNEIDRPPLVISHDPTRDWASTNCPTSDSSPVLNDPSLDFSLLHPSPESDVGDAITRPLLVGTPALDDISYIRTPPRETKVSDYRIIQKDSTKRLELTLSFSNSPSLDEYFSSSSSSDARDVKAYSPAYDIVDVSPNSRASHISHSTGNTSPRKGYFPRDQAKSSLRVAEYFRRDGKIKPESNEGSFKKFPYATRKTQSKVASRPVPVASHTVTPRQQLRRKNSSALLPSDDSHQNSTASQFNDSTADVHSQYKGQVNTSVRLGNTDQTVFRSNTLPAALIHNSSYKSYDTNVEGRLGVAKFESSAHNVHLPRMSSNLHINSTPIALASQALLPMSDKDADQSQSSIVLSREPSMKEIYGSKQGKIMLEKAQANQKRLSLLKDKGLPSYLSSTMAQLNSFRRKSLRRDPSKENTIQTLDATQQKSAIETNGTKSDNNASLSHSSQDSSSGFIARFRKQIHSPWRGDKIHPYHKGEQNDVHRLRADTEPPIEAPAITSSMALLSSQSSEKIRHGRASVYAKYPDSTKRSQPSRWISHRQNANKPVLLPSAEAANNIPTPADHNKEESSLSAMSNGNIAILSPSFSSLYSLSASVMPQLAATMDPQKVCTPELVVSIPMTPERARAAAHKPSSEHSLSRDLESSANSSIHGSTSSPAFQVPHEPQQFSEAAPVPAPEKELLPNASEPTSATVAQSTPEEEIPSSNLQTPVSPPETPSTITTPTSGSVYMNSSSHSEASSNNSQSQPSNTESNWSISSNSVRQRLTFSSGTMSNSLSASISTSSSGPNSIRDFLSPCSSPGALSLRTNSDHSNSSSRNHSLVGQMLLGHSVLSRSQTTELQISSSDTTFQEANSASASVTPEKLKRVNYVDPALLPDEAITEKPFLQEHTPFEAQQEEGQQSDISLDDIVENANENTISISTSRHSGYASTRSVTLQEDNFFADFPYVEHNRDSSNATFPATLTPLPASLSTTSPILATTGQDVSLAECTLSPQEQLHRERQDSLIAALFDLSINSSLHALYQEPVEYMSYDGPRNKESDDAPVYEANHDVGAARAWSILRPTSATPETTFEHATHPEKLMQVIDKVVDNHEVTLVNSPQAHNDTVMPLTTTRAPSSEHLSLSADLSNPIPSRHRPRIHVSPVPPLSDTDGESQLLSSPQQPSSEPLSTDLRALTPSGASIPMSSQGTSTSIMGSSSFGHHSSAPITNRLDDQAVEPPSDRTKPQTLETNSYQEGGRIEMHHDERLKTEFLFSPLSHFRHANTPSRDAKESPFWTLSPGSDHGIRFFQSPLPSDSKFAHHPTALSPHPPNEIILSAPHTIAVPSPSTRRMSDGAKLSTLIYPQQPAIPSDLGKIPTVRAVLNLVDTIDSARASIQPTGDGGAYGTESGPASQSENEHVRQEKVLEVGAPDKKCDTPLEKDFPALNSSLEAVLLSMIRKPDCTKSSLQCSAVPEFQQSFASDAENVQCADHVTSMNSTALSSIERPSFMDNTETRKLSDTTESIIPKSLAIAQHPSASYSLDFGLTVTPGISERNTTPEFELQPQTSLSSDDIGFRAEVSQSRNNSISSNNTPTKRATRYRPQSGSGVSISHSQYSRSRTSSGSASLSISKSSLGTSANQRPVPTSLANAFKAYGATLNESGMVTITSSKSKQRKHRRSRDVQPASRHSTSSGSLTSRSNSFTDQMRRNQSIVHEQNSYFSFSTQDFEHTSEIPLLQSDDFTSSPPIVACEENW